MTVEVDEAEVRRFLTIISNHAIELAKSAPRPGVLQLCCLSPVDDKLIPHRFQLDDVDGMVKLAVAAGNAGLNVYIEGRTVRADLRGPRRGTEADTEFVFALVVDSDHDKGRAGVIDARPTLTIETSPGNCQYWYFFSQPVLVKQAKTIGEALRAATGADADTGVVTQCYRVAGTPNYPSKAKQKRGRTTIEPTRPIEQTGRVWDPHEPLTATAQGAGKGSKPVATVDGLVAAEASLPDDLLKGIREGGVSKGGDASRSGLFHHMVGELRKRRWTVEQINALLEKHPNGVAAKYQRRLLAEIQRSYDKVDDNGPGSVQAGPQAAAGGSGGGSPPPASGAAPGAAPAPGAGASARVLPTIRIRNGQLPRVVKEAEKAVLDSGAAIFARAGRLVYPVSESAPAANGGQTVMARLSEFTVDSFVEPVAEAAIFQRHNARAKTWVDVDPPVQLVRMMLARERRWSFPRVAGVVTTPTLRPDGSLFSVPGYDPRTELYLCLGLAMPTIPQAPTRDEARAALKALKDLFDEFSFKRRAPALDLTVALSGLLTTLLRGSLPSQGVRTQAASCCCGR
jgi:hypothetical protein